jgi:hypothetical protein
MDCLRHRTTGLFLKRLLNTEHMVNTIAIVQEFEPKVSVVMTIRNHRISN